MSHNVKAFSIEAALQIDLVSRALPLDESQLTQEALYDGKKSMSLPVSDNDLEKDGKNSPCILEKHNVPVAATETEACNDQNGSSEVKPDFETTPGATTPTGNEVMRIMGDKHNNTLNANKRVDPEAAGEEYALSKKANVLLLSNVQHHGLLDSSAETPDRGTPPEPRSDKAIERASNSQVRTDHRPLSLQSSPRTAIRPKVNGPMSSASAIEKPKDAEVRLAEPTKTEEEDSQSEIQSIMEQFDEQTSVADTEDQISKQMTSAENAFLLLRHPPRTSSLDDRSKQSPTLEKSPSNTYISQSASRFPRMETTQESEHDTDPAATSAKRSSYASLTRPSSQPFGSPLSPRSSISLHKALPPASDPEPDLPFDFHRFLDQLRHRTADPVAKFLRSFLVEFGKKQWMVHEQVKIICDFQLFITNKMAQCEVWRDVSDAEFDNAKEGMEKLVMNRLYTQTFSPAIPPPIHAIKAKTKTKAQEKADVSGRQGQHQEDIERDEILAQKIRIYSWVSEEHLDVPIVGERGRRFLNLARQGDTRTPQD